MARIEVAFECTSCGYQSAKWLGNCPQCSSWNCFVEVERVAVAHARKSGGGHAASDGHHGSGTRAVVAQKINEVAVDSMARISTNIEELDRVLGGGMVSGMTVLLGGNPGIGKSTLMSQLAASAPVPTLYVGSEETAVQMKIRITRLQLQEASFHVISTHELEQIIYTLSKLKSKLIVIDSIQMLQSLNYSNVPGSVVQLRACCQTLIDWVRENGAALFLVAHVTKEGSIAGPKLIEHLVDTVLYFDDANEQVRFLRATKNRFGNVQELGIFTLGERGLTPLTDPSSILRSERSAEQTVGVVLVPVYEGSRVLLIEIQALTVPSLNNNARVYSDIIDPRRISRIAAVLERHVGVSLSGQDVYLNIAGGIRVHEVAIDLGIAHALYSAATNTPPPSHFSVFGEVSLAGEVCPVPQMARRVRTARELGCVSVIGPCMPAHSSEKQHTKREIPSADRWQQCRMVADSIQRAFPTK